MLPLMVAMRGAAVGAAAGGLVVLLSACTGGSATPGGSTGQVPTGSPTSTLAPADAVAVGRAVIREAQLQQAVQAQIDRFGRRVAALRPVVAGLNAHVLALQAAGGVSEGPLLAPAPAPSSTPATAIRRSVAGLRAASVAAGRPVVDPTAATTGAVAGLMASVSASDAALADAVGSPLSAVAVPRSPAVTPAGSSSVDALQTALAGEDAAVYAYGVVGGQLAAHGATPAQVAAAQSGLDAHRARRDQLVTMIQAAGGAANPGAGGYVLPTPVEGVAAARRLAAVVEGRCAGNYAQLVVAAGSPPDRAPSLGWLRDAALRQAAWSGRAPVLPGLQPASVTP
jgi:hypothetical protein